MAAANTEPNQTIPDFIQYLETQIGLLGQGPPNVFGGNYHPICDHVTWGLDHNSRIQRYIYSPFLRLKDRIDRSDKRLRVYSLLEQFGREAIPWLLACIQLRLQTLNRYATLIHPHRHSDRCPNYGHIYPISQSFIALGFCLKLSQRDFNFNVIPANLEEGEIFNPQTFQEFALANYPNIRQLPGFNLYERVPTDIRYSTEVCIFRIIGGEKGLRLYRDFCEDCGREPCSCAHTCDECSKIIDTKYLFLNDTEIGEYHIYHKKTQEEIVGKIREIFKKENIGDFDISKFANKIADLRCACGLLVKEGDKSSHILCSFLHFDLRLKGEFSGYDLQKAILLKYKPEEAMVRYGFKKTRKSVKKSKTKRSKAKRSKTKTKRSVKRSKAKTKRSVKKSKRSIKKMKRNIFKK